MLLGGINHVAGLTADTGRFVGSSKGAFFHHLSSNADLGTVLVERYARADAEMFDRLMTEAESRTTDPAQQLIEFVRVFEDGIEDLSLSQPGCLFVSFIYEQFAGQDDTRALILGDIVHWRERILAKLHQAAERRPLALPPISNRSPTTPSPSSKAASSSPERRENHSSFATSCVNSGGTSPCC